jgi:hypothetical protein
MMELNAQRARLFRDRHCIRLRQQFVAVTEQGAAIERADPPPAFLAFSNAKEPFANQFWVIFTLRHDACT